MDTQYAYSNDSDHAPEHHRALAELLNPGSTERVRGLMDLTDKRCLDVGAGGGTYAYWLATKVGSHGQVVATDLRPQHIPPHPRMRILTHDIVTDPLPEPGTFDFADARLVLNHLVERRKAFHNLVSALAPGGWLLTEDFSSHPPEVWVAHTPDRGDAALLRDYHAAQLAVLDAHGNDRTWATTAHGAMVEAGLINVQTIVRSESWRGGGPGCRLIAAGLAQVRVELIGLGMKPVDLDRVQELLRNPEVELHGHHLYSTSGQRPAT
jgi:SAM-dependent methyltransferase